jgi:exosortase/archaeosortase family protein
MNTKEKIRFILVFFISYFLFLAIGVFIFGNFLVGLEEKLIFWLLGNNVNYEAFDFVVYCSGIVSVSAYLGVIIALKTIKQKISNKAIAVSTIVLFLVNLLRIIVVMLSEKAGLHQELHIISWFLMLFVVVWLVKITSQKQ